MPPGAKVGLSLGHIVLDGDPAPPKERGTAAPTFRPTLLWHDRGSPISATAELLLYLWNDGVYTINVTPVSSTVQYLFDITVNQVMCMNLLKADLT